MDNKKWAEIVADHIGKEHLLDLLKVDQINISIDLTYKGNDPKLIEIIDSLSNP